jgi:hypothetical protein
MKINTKNVRIKEPLKVTKRYIWFENEHNKKYYLNIESYFHLLEAYNRINQKLDAPIIITGAVGSGKSNKAIGLCGTWENFFFDRSYNLDNVHFTAISVMNEMDREDNYTKAINFDESINGGSSGAAISKVGKALKSKLITKRFKKHLTIFTVDNLKELNEKIIERCIVWYHVYYIRDKNGIYHKGIYKAFSPEQALRVYEDLKDKKCRDILKHPIFINNPINNNDPDYSNLWYSEKDYDSKKAKETSEEEEQNDDVPLKHIIAYQLWLQKKKYTEIAEIIDTPRTTLTEWIKKLDKRIKEYKGGL